MTMLRHQKPATYFIGVFLVVLCGAGFSFSHSAKGPFPKPELPYLSNEEDTVKYRGYRLDLTNFEVLKRTDDWVKIRCTIINSGRVDVDFSKKGTEHWVQVNFDQSLFDNKLGGLRANIRQALYDDDFKLPVGKTQPKQELKVPVLLSTKSAPTKPETELVSEPEIATKPSVPENQNPAVLTGKGGEEEFSRPAPTRPGIAEDCPDIYFHRLRIIEQDDKWATLEYTLGNKGHGAFKLFDKNLERLLIKAFISGVPTLSRGALPVGEQVVKLQPGQPNDLQPGGTFTGRIKLDVRKKTRYLKSLILSLDSDQFKLECDKTNNTGAVILD